MKGIIFLTLQKLVEEKFGIEVWDELLSSSEPPLEGVYTSGDTYEDGELLQLVVALSEKSGIGVPDLVRTFGEYTFHELARKFPHFLEGKDIMAFIASVHDVVHVEVKKLYPEAQLPEFICESTSDTQMILRYHSARDLPQMAQGLIEGASKHFGVPVDQKIEKVEDGKYRFTLDFKP